MPLPDVVTTCEYRSPHPFSEGRVTGIIDDLWENWYWYLAGAVVGRENLLLALAEAK